MKKRTIIPLGLFIILFCLLGLLSKIESNKHGRKIVNAIDLSVDYLIRNLENNGKFIYYVNLDSTVIIRSKYNILRHAGTMYSMLEHYKLKPQKKTYDALLSAGSFLQKKCLLPVFEENMVDLYAIWSVPELSGSSTLLQAKLGGTGLGLVALCGLEKIESGFTDIRKLRGLGNFILYMQEETGEFCSKYVPSQDGKMYEWKSLYYPGEAILGLLMLNEIDPDERWVDGAVKGLSYLAEIRKDKVSIPADHWVLIATEHLLSYSDAKLPVALQQQFIDHAVQICKSILTEQITEYPFPEIIGGFTPEGRTAPTATRLEGLLSASNFLPEGNRALIDKIEKASLLGVNFLLNSQVTKGTFAGGIPRAVQIKDYDEFKLNNRVNVRSTEIRIDYVQHAISAWMLYLKQFNDKK